VLGATILSTAAGAQAKPREISRQQAQQFADAAFQRFDLNHDGVITRDEAEQARAQLTQGSEGKRAAKSEKMIDRIFGTSQSVTKGQFEAMALARFDRQDANHDGVVTSAEREQARGSRQVPQ
jgi:Ca2+-binding EF-hand superfamily protein